MGQYVEFIDFNDVFLFLFLVSSKNVTYSLDLSLPVYYQLYNISELLTSNAFWCCFVKKFPAVRMNIGFAAGA